MAKSSTGTSLFETHFANWPNIDQSKACGHGQLDPREEMFGMLAFAAEFERAEILVPGAFWHFWLGFHPDTELI